MLPAVCVVAGFDNVFVRFRLSLRLSAAALPSLVSSPSRSSIARGKRRERERKQKEEEEALNAKRGKRRRMLAMKAKTSPTPSATTTATTPANITTTKPAG